jgi:hypothetical protein
MRIGQQLFILPLGDDDIEGYNLSTQEAGKGFRIACLFMSILTTETDKIRIIEWVCEIVCTT